MSSEIGTFRDGEFCDGGMIIEAEYRAFSHLYASNPKTSWPTLAGFVASAGNDSGLLFS